MEACHERYKDGISYADSFSKLYDVHIILLFGNLPAAQGQAISSSGSTKKTGMDLKGIWSGTLYSKHSDVARFTLTVGHQSRREWSSGW